jgi:hypothetical protein
MFKIATLDATGSVDRLLPSLKSGRTPTRNWRAIHCSSVVWMQLAPSEMFRQTPPDVTRTAMAYPSARDAKL